MTSATVADQTRQYGLDPAQVCDLRAHNLQLVLSENPCLVAVRPVIEGQ